MRPHKQSIMPIYTLTMGNLLSWWIQLP